MEAIIADTTPCASAAVQATNTIPVLTVRVGDPVAAGLVKSLARPGTNVTGTTVLAPELFQKALELLKETLPRATRVLVFKDPSNASHDVLYRKVSEAAERLSLQVDHVGLRTSTEIEPAFASPSVAAADAFFFYVLPIGRNGIERLSQLALRRRVPTMAVHRAYVETGSLMSYATNDWENFRRIAFYIDRILKGAKPADLPVEQPTKFEFVINLKTAKALGLTIPPSVRLRADEVIQ